MCPLFPIHMLKTVRRTFRYSAINSAAHRTTDWIGSVPSLLVHTALFAISFALVLFGVDFERILLIVTTVVSLEAIYLAIFIQMAINHNSQSLDAVEEDIDEIQKDLDEIQEDVVEIQKEESEEDIRDRQNKMVLDKIEGSLGDLIRQIEKMKGELR